MYSWYHTTVQSNGATRIGGVGSKDNFTGRAVSTACVGSEDSLMLDA